MTQTQFDAIVRDIARARFKLLPERAEEALQSLQTTARPLVGGAPEVFRDLMIGALNWALRKSDSPALNFWLDQWREALLRRP